MKGQDVIFSKKSDNWRTPPELFTELSIEFPFTLDGAADATNHLCPVWLGPDGRSSDALVTTLVNEVVWLNPPYSAVGKFIEWVDKNKKDNTFVCLLPARTDTKWFHKYIYENPAVEIRFLKGRLKFSNSKNSAPFPSMIVIFRRP